MVKTKWTIFHPTSKKRFMPTKLPELSINSIIMERETVTKSFVGYLLTNMPQGKRILTQFFPRLLGILYRTWLIVPRKQLNQLFFLFALNFGPLIF